MSGTPFLLLAYHVWPADGKMRHDMTATVKLRRMQIAFARQGI